MSVLIDGNNLLYAARDAEESDKLLGRGMLCARLAEWAERFGQSVWVVFDGPAPAQGLAAQIARKPILVTYSGAGVSADERLMEILESNSAARRLLVVSTDRQVARAARRRRARTSRADVFWARLRRDLARPQRNPLEPPEKWLGLNGQETQEWLRTLGFESGEP